MCIREIIVTDPYRAVGRCRAALLCRFLSKETKYKEKTETNLENPDTLKQASRPCGGQGIPAELKTGTSSHQGKDHRDAEIGAWTPRDEDKDKADLLAREGALSPLNGTGQLIKMLQKDGPGRNTSNCGDHSLSMFAKLTVDKQSQELTKSILSLGSDKFRLSISPT